MATEALMWRICKEPMFTRWNFRGTASVTVLQPATVHLEFFEREDESDVEEEPFWIANPNEIELKSANELVYDGETFSSWYALLSRYHRHSETDQIPVRVIVYHNGRMGSLFDQTTSFDDARFDLMYKCSKDNLPIYINPNTLEGLYSEELSKTSDISTKYMLKCNVELREGQVVLVDSIWKPLHPQ